MTDFIVSILAFVFGAALVLGLTAARQTPTPLAARLESLGSDDISNDLTSSEEALQAPFFDRVIRPALQQLAQKTARWTPHGAAEAARMMLAQAGLTQRLGVNEFLGLRVASMIVFICLAFFAARFLGHTPMIKLAAFGFSVLIGLALPDALLQQKIRERQQSILRRLPETLELLTICLDAGLGFDIALTRVADRIPGPLAAEMKQVQDEILLGKTRAAALQDMARRTGLKEMQAFTAAISQAEQLGTGMAEALRAQSETVRVQRAQRIRETAARLPVKMLFPLIFLIFPALFVVLLGPALVNLFRMLGGH